MVFELCLRCGLTSISFLTKEEGVFKVNSTFEVSPYLLLRLTFGRSMRDMLDRRGVSLGSVCVCAATGEISGLR